RACGGAGTARVRGTWTSSPRTDSVSSGITGSQVTVTGTTLTGASGVKFGGLQARFTVLSGTQIRATVPDGAVAAPVSVTTPLGTATSAQHFVPTPPVTGYPPPSGPVGTALELHG